jgi:phosphate-selective porin OprO and OprP
MTAALPRSTRDHHSVAAAKHRGFTAQDALMVLISRSVLVVGVLFVVASASAQDALSQQRAVADQLAAHIEDGTSSLLSPAKDRMKITGQFQFRYNFNQRDDPTLAEESAMGLHIRRIRVKVGGKIGGGWRYKVSTEFKRSSGVAGLSSAYIRRKLDNGFDLTFGQFKLPFTRENLVSSQRQLAVDRSVASSFFSVGRSQGVRIIKEHESFRFTFALSDGASAKNTDFTSTKEADFGLTARGEYRITGNDWSAFKQLTSFKGSPVAAMVGAAVHYQTGGDTFATVDADMTAFTVDISVLGDGYNAFAAFMWTQTEFAASPDTENSGIVVQGGYFIDRTWEVFGRYDVIFSEQVDDFSTLTVGANKYLVPQSHAAKVTADIQFFLDAQGTSDAPATTRTGLLASGEDGQWALRVQMQLLF